MCRLRRPRKRVKPNGTALGKRRGKAICAAYEVAVDANDLRIAPISPYSARRGGGACAAGPWGAGCASDVATSNRLRHSK